MLGPSGLGVAVGVLRRRAGVDDVRVVGVHGGGGAPRGVVVAGDADVNEDVPYSLRAQLVPPRQLHGVRVQPMIRGPALVPEAASALHAAAVVENPLWRTMA